SWIKVAPESAKWRDGAMAVLARSFLQSSHSAYVQQRLAESLAATGMSGVTYLFKQALRHPEAGMRKAAVIGLTRTAQDSDLPALEAALADKDPTVCEAIIRGLVHLGTDAATRLLARIFLEEDETFSSVAAEALAQCGKEGKDFLREAVESEDTVARRAAVFGLAQVEGTQNLLEKVAREDEQWIVRTAATTALDELEEQKKISGVAPPLEIDQLPWLISWAATLGEGVGLGDAARRMLRRALTEGDAPTRLATIQVLTQMGRPDDVEPLRTAMTGSEPDVVSAAMEALAEISERYALRIK
ncbi:MAG: HEAT repeat domain-containing protein, partial [Anaerolineae bacterium]